MATAAAYIRVSSERQDEYSPDSQIKLIREYAAKNGYELPDSLIFFDDGISAKSAVRRVEFNRMISMAKEKTPPFDAILVWKFSRFARNQEESIVYKNLLRKKGIQVISISEPISDSPFGDLIERIIEWMDEYYLINLSAEVKRGMEERISRGEPLCPPSFGYGISDGRYVINPDEAMYVVRFFTAFAQGVSLRQIALDCRAERLLTHRGNPFESRTIRYILSNPVYIGKLRRFPAAGHTSELVDGIHEPIVSRELWDTVQNRLALSRKYERRDQRTDWMLKGLVRCECGATLTRLTSSPPSMQCCKYTKGRECEVSHYLSINKANRLVFENLFSVINDREYFLSPENITEHKIDFGALIKSEQNKLEKARDAYLSGIDTLDEYRQTKKRILKDIDMLECESRKAQKLRKYSSVKTAHRIFETLTDPAVSEKAKHEALRSVILKIVFSKSEKCLDFYFYI